LSWEGLGLGLGAKPQKSLDVMPQPGLKAAALAQLAQLGLSSGPSFCAYYVQH